MESDISQPKSRSFNILLRFFQLGLALTAALFVAEYMKPTCLTSDLRLIQILTLTLVGFNFLALVYLRCKNQFPRCEIFFSFLINIGLLVTIYIFVWKGYKSSSNCAVTDGVFHFMLLSITYYFIEFLLILTFSFNWIQRYTNSPGNIVWLVYFFMSSWYDRQLYFMISLIILMFLVSFFTFLANCFAICKVTTCIKKFIISSWIISFLLMIAAEVLAIFAYFQFKTLSDYLGLLGTTIVSIFILVNVIDMMFWLFGLMTLEYENGDSIRDELINFGRNDQAFGESSRVEKYDGRHNYDY